MSCPSSHSRSNTTSETGVIFDARAIARSPRQVHALLQHLERRSPGVVERDDLAVDHRVHLVDELVHHVQLGVLRSWRPARCACAAASRRSRARPGTGCRRASARTTTPGRRTPPSRPRRASARSAAARRSAARPARSRGRRASPVSSSRSGTRGRGSAGRAARTRPSCRSTRPARTSRRRRCAPRRRRSGPRGSCPRTSPYSSGWTSVCTASRLSPLAIGKPFGHRPRREPAVALEPHVVVQPGRAVLVDHERVAARRDRRRAPARSCPRGRSRAGARTRTAPGPSRRRRSPRRCGRRRSSRRCGEAGASTSGARPRRRGVGLVVDARAPRARSSGPPPRCARRRTGRRPARSAPRRCRSGSPPARSRPRTPRPT